MRIIATRIKELRNERALSLEKMSELTKISKSAISRWENGNADIASDYLIVLCKFFGVSADYLLGLED